MTAIETDNVFKEISELLPTLCTVGGSKFIVKHNLLFTMIDGNVCNALTGTRYTQKCYTCVATPKMKNDEVKG